MKMKIRSRITAILAAVLLVFAMMPMTASAEGAAEGHAGQSGWTEWTSTDSLPDRTGKYYLKGDVTIDSTWSVPNGETTLCLNGKTIRLSENGSGSVINIPDKGKLTICDHSSDESGCITGGKAYQGGGVFNSGAFTLEGGSISGNKASDGSYNYGGGVYSIGTFTMEGGSIIDNTATHGGGVRNEDTFTMEGGSIHDNTATNSGGGVDNYSSGTFTMEGGSIHDNTATNSGGGVGNNGTFNMKGGSISGNTAAYSYGGVYNNGTINIGSGENGESRDIIISGNKAYGKTSNVYLWEGVKINVTGNVSRASRIGVTTNDTPSSAQAPRVFTSGLSGKGSISNFFSDEGYAVSWTEGDSREAQLIDHVHDWTIEKAEGSDDTFDIRCIGYTGMTCPYRLLEVPAKADNRDYTGKPYDGAAINDELPPALSVTWTYTGREGTTYGPSETAPTNAGAYTAEAKIMVDADPDTNGTISLPFTINKAPLTVTAREQTYVYNGFEQGPGDAVYEDPAELVRKVAASGLRGGDKLTQVKVDGQAGPKIGLYPTALTPDAAEINGGKSTENYEITYVNGPIRITPIPLKVTIRGSSATKKYNGKEQTYKGTVTVTSSDNAFDPSKFRYTGSTTVRGTWAGTYTTALATEKCIYSDPLYELNVTVGDPIRLTIKQASEPDPTPDPKPDPTPDPKPDPKPDRAGGPLIAKMTAKGKKSLTLSWTGVEGADGYDVFFTRCNHGKTHLKCRKVKTIRVSAGKEGTIKWTKKGLKKEKAYKAYVKAWAMKDGRKTYIRTSPVVHAYTSGYTKTHTNARSVTVEKTKVLLTVGKASDNTFRIRAEVRKLKNGKKLMSKKHAPKLRYLSSDKRIATVSKSGKITAKSKGKCRIYVYAVNGVSRTVHVTVK